MKLIDGDDIRRFIQYQTLVVNENSIGGWDGHLRNLLRQLTRGVDALHSQSILHRDLKPSNVLVDRSGHLTILDFGLSTSHAPETFGESLDLRPVGTLPYMSPEQMLGEELTTASDWFSVGAMLYELLSGRPFLGEVRSFGAFIEAKKAREYEGIEEINPTAPTDLCELCRRLLDPEPSSRPDAGEILEIVGASVAEVDTAAEESPLDSLFVGRESLQDELEQALEDSRQAAVVVHVQGESGVGKSTLTSRFVNTLARENRAVVLSGCCHLRKAVSYPGLDEVAEGLSRYLRGLRPDAVNAVLPRDRDTAALAQQFSVLQLVESIAALPIPIDLATDPQHAKRRAARAFRDLLTRIGDRLPLVIQIDDMQWCDRETALFLSDLVAPPARRSSCCSLVIEARRLDKTKQLTSSAATTICFET